MPPRRGRPAFSVDDAVAGLPCEIRVGAALAVLENATAKPARTASTAETMPATRRRRRLRVMGRGSGCMASPGLGRVVWARPSTAPWGFGVAPRRRGGAALEQIDPAGCFRERSLAESCPGARRMSIRTADDVSITEDRRIERPEPGHVSWPGYLLSDPAMATEENHGSATSDVVRRVAARCPGTGTETASGTGPADRAKGQYQSYRPLIVVLSGLYQSYCPLKAATESRALTCPAWCGHIDG